MREMFAAGKYFDRDHAMLRAEIDAHYHGPHSPPSDETQKHVLGAIVPNSPYRNCGDCLAWTYQRIALTPAPDVYVLVASVSGNASGVATQAFLTPLEIMRVDQQLALALAGKGAIAVRDDLFREDYQIEVQLPFLQHTRYARMEQLKILPILIGTDADIPQMALDLKEVLIEQGKTAVVIVSTNMTQYGPLFHHVPFVEDAQRHIMEQDKGFLGFVTARDIPGMYCHVQQHLMNIPGVSAVEFLLRFLRPCKGELLQYYTSTDVNGDTKNCVGYASAVFEQP